MTTWKTEDAWVVVFRPKSLRRICNVFDRKEDAVKDKKERMENYTKITGADDIPENKEEHYFVVEKVRSTIFQSEK